MKPVFKAIAAIGALAALVAALVLLQNRPAREPVAGTDAEPPVVITQESAVSGMSLENQHGSLRFEKDADGEWTVAGREYAKLGYDATGMALTLDGLAARETISAPSDLEEFGLARPAAVISATHINGVTDTLLIGSKGVTGNVYYCMLEGGADVYLINGIAAERMLNHFNDFRETELPSVDIEAISKLYIKNADEEIDLVSGDPESEKAQFGMTYLKMVTPVEGRDVSASSLEEQVYAHIGAIRSIGGFIEDNAPDLSRYGLDEPCFVFRAEDADGGKLHLLFGSDTEDGGIYFMLAGEGHVYSMPKAGVEPLMKVRAFYLTDRFVVLFNILDVESVVIDDGGTEWVLSMERFEEDGDTVEVFRLNGVTVEESPFRKLYQWVISIMGDAPVEDGASASGRPEVVLTYNFNNGDTPVTLELYPFDNHFYTVAVDGELKVFSSRRYMDNLRAALENI